MRETGTGQQVAQLHDRYMMMMIPVCEYFTYAGMCIFYICQYVHIVHMPVCEYFKYASRCQSVCWLRYGPEDRGIVFQFPTGAAGWCLFLSLRARFRAVLASSLKGCEGPLPGAKADGSWKWKLPSLSAAIMCGTTSPISYMYSYWPL